MDFYNNLRAKFREKTNYEEQISEKKNLKEEIFRKQLQRAQSFIKEEKELPKRLRFDVAHHLKIHMNGSELKEMNKLRDEYTNTTYMVSALSVLNIICIGAFIKDFWNQKWYSKFAISAIVFSTSHYCGMYSMEQKTKAFQIQMINQYKDKFIQSNFLQNKLSYDPTKPDPHLQIRQKNPYQINQVVGEIEQ